MSESVKKRSASNIYFGIDAATGTLKHIAEVPSGKKCNCYCAACGKPLEARKGDLRRHHYAHISNYDCMYSSEISIYKALSVIMEAERSIITPPVTIYFPSWNAPETIRPAETIAFDSVEFKCEELAYPPDLFLSVHDSKLRILIDFAHYYDDRDKRVVFEQEAKQQGYSCLMYHVASVDKEDCFTPERLKLLLTDSSNAEWIFNRVEDRWHNQFYSVAVRPAEHGSGYECALHIGYYKGKYSARWEDCAYCRYNVAEAGDCLCTANSGIQSIADFACNPLELKKRTENIREENDKQRQQEDAAVKVHRSIQASCRAVKAIRPQFSRSCSPTEAEFLEEQQRIAVAFDILSPEWTVDKYGRRWIKCKECGRILRDIMMAYYGGHDGVNQGVCTDCSRRQ